MSDLVVKNKVSPLDYFLTFLLVAISGVNFFLGNTYLFFCFVLNLFLFSHQYRTSAFLPKYLILIGLCIAGSAIWYTRFDLNNYISLLFRILTAYLILGILGRKFVYCYVRVLYFICLFGLACWVMFVISPAIERFFIYNVTSHFNFYDYASGSDDDHSRSAPQFVLYTMNFGESGILENDADYISSLTGTERIFMRNSLCFTEPSTAMLFVIPALFFNLVLTKKILNKRNIVFILAVFTSTSTGGFAVLFFVLAGWISTNKDISVLRPFLVPMALLAAYLAFVNIESFGSEILDELNLVSSENIDYAVRTRFVSGVLDVQESLTHPLFGKGFKNYETWNYYEHRNNGTTFLLNRYGYFIFFLYFFFMYKYFKSLCMQCNVDEKFALVMVFAIILIGFGNKNFEKPIFIGMTMLYFIVREIDQRYPHSPIHNDYIQG
ncbi:MAG: hypothetical protein ACXVPQ_01445 [Bacteroidia bacterium]